MRWRLLPISHASAAPSSSDNRRAHGFRPARATVPATPPADRDDVLAQPHPTGIGLGACRWLTYALVAPTRPVHGGREALQLFCDDLLQDVPIQTQIATSRFSF